MLESGGVRRRGVMYQAVRGRVISIGPQDALPSEQVSSSLQMKKKIPSLTIAAKNDNAFHHYH